MRGVNVLFRFLVRRMCATVFAEFGSFQFLGLYTFLVWFATHIVLLLAGCAIDFLEITCCHGFLKNYG
jgi:hypothetical protein